VKPSTQRLWVRRFHEADGAKTGLVCFPHAGGSASYFYRLSAALSPDFDVTAIQYPGRQDRYSEPFVKTIDDLADHIFAVLNPMIDRPIALFGHSMGAVVGFEVARRFEKSAGIKPTTVFVSAMRAPGRFGEETTQVEDDAGLINRMRTLGGTDPLLLADPKMLEMVLPAFRNDIRALDQYRRDREVRIGAPITVMTASDDSLTSMDQATAWEQHTSGDCTVHIFNGGHFYLEKHPHRVVTVIAETLRSRHSE